MRIGIENMSNDKSKVIEPLTLSVSEAAKLIGVCGHTLYAQAKRGAIPSIKVGRRVLIPRSFITSLVSGDVAISK